MLTPKLADGSLMFLAFPNKNGLTFTHKPLVIDPDSNLVVLAHGGKNYLESYKLEVASPAPHLQTLFFFHPVHAIDV